MYKNNRKICKMADVAKKQSINLEAEFDKLDTINWTLGIENDISEEGRKKCLLEKNSPIL